ncbi:HrgA protein [Bartonella queenslandensis]|uniref:HrgA protein n=1 Tax=Bartonella queenslandensis TaxID=481138 RepID=UPI0002ED34C4|nr:HrgA protein [Bartonella queenslandensis]
MLSSLHEIGFIRLDKENASESEIIIPAKERSDIDWDTANRLVEENKDFLHYIKLIRQFYQTGEMRPSDWDHMYP